MVHEVQMGGHGEVYTKHSSSVSAHIIRKNTAALDIFILYNVKTFTASSLNVIYTHAQFLKANDGETACVRRKSNQGHQYYAYSRLCIQY